MAVSVQLLDSVKIEAGKTLTQVLDEERNSEVPFKWKMLCIQERRFLWLPGERRMRIGLL